MTDWSAFNSGTWTTGSNWTGGVAPNGIGAIANFVALPSSGSNVATVSITAGTSVTVGQLSLNANNFGRYAITRSSTGSGTASLILNDSDGEANVNFDSGTHSINNFSGSQRLDIVLNSNALFNGDSSAALLSTDCTFTGTGRLILAGSGTLDMTGTTANTYSGGTEIRSGTLGVSASGALGTGDITFGHTGTPTSFEVTSRLRGHANVTLTNNALRFRRETNTIITADAGTTLTLDNGFVSFSTGGRAITFGETGFTGTVVFGGANGSGVTSNLGQRHDVTVNAGTLRIGGFTGQVMLQNAGTTTVAAGATLDLGTSGISTRLLVNNGTIRSSTTSLLLTAGLANTSMTGTFVGGTSSNALDLSHVFGAANQNISFSLGGATFTNWVNGRDTISITSGSGQDYLTGSVQNDTINAGSGNDFVQGLGGSDFIDTGAGNDFAFGGTGNDVLVSSGGFDYLDGGVGFDIARFTGNAADATITRLGNGMVQVTAGGVTSTVVNTEVLQFDDRAVALRERARTDMDGNSNSDLVLQNSTTLIAWNVANGVATGSTFLGGLGGSTTFRGTGDFDNDGTTDLLVQEGGNLFAWTVSNGTVTAGTPIGAVGGFSVAGTGDFDRDGTTDVLLFDGSQLLSWDVQRNAATAANTIGFLGSGFTVAGTGDFNGDGTTDVLLQTGTTFIAWNIVNHTLVGGAVIGTVGGGFSMIGMGDFNGDGTTDLLLRNGSTLATWSIVNNGISGMSFVGNADPSFNVVGTGDYNGDGTADIAFQGNGMVLNWTMQNGTRLTDTFVGNSGPFNVVA